MSLIDMSETYQMTNVGDHIDGTDVYQSNRNLLDNPWFTVRQRGNGPFSEANTEAFDRWRATSNATLTGTANGITITTTVRTWGMQQRVAKGFFTVGKTYTISAMEQDGTITSATFTWTGSGISKYVTGANVGFEISTSNGNYEQIYFTTNYVGSVDLRAVKLELGSVSTLANDVPPNYAEELAKCQRYFLRLKSSSQALPLGFGIQSSSTAVRLLVPTPVEMRAQPTVSFSGTHRIFGGDATSKTVSSYSVVDRTSSGIGLVANISSGTFAENKAYILYVASGGYLDLSADL